VRELVRQNLRFFVLATLAGLVLRLIFILRFPAITADSLVYGDIAKNWLQHGIYGITGIGDITPTSIRLPGYPAFLAAVFAIFGIEHYRVALALQMFVDIGTCFLIADLTRRVLSERAAKGAFWLAALCPFFANYAGAALTETWEIFFTVLALDLAVAALENVHLWYWVGCGAAIAGAILLRPDGGLLLGSIGIWLLVLLVRRNTLAGMPASQMIKAGVIVAFVALAPLVPWTLRNLHTLHEFQPLAPRYANEEGDFVPMGFNRWVKTWLADYASVEEIYWAEPESPIDATKLPSRAFDSPQQREATEQLIDDYNHSLRISPELDARLASLATERIHHSRFRYYIWLPVLRIADMWLRPRTEILPCNSRWWEFDEDEPWLVLTIAIAILNLLYIGAAKVGWFRVRFSSGMGLLITFVLLRSAFLGTLENPEPRYTLECYPIVIVLAGACFQRRSTSVVN